MSGASICVTNLNTIFSNLVNEAKSATEDWAKETMEISQNEFVPIDKGVLRDTGKVKTLTGSTREYVLQLSFGEGIDYAIKQHEIPMSHRHGQDHYLSTPFTTRSSLLMQNLVSRCSGVIH